MSEITLAFIAFGKLTLVCLYALCYGLGGTNGLKFMRHWVAPMILILGCLLIAFIFKRLDVSAISLITIFIPPHLGYGAKTTWGKVIKRAIYGSVFALSAIIISIAYHSIGLGIFQAILAISASIYFGVLNPCKSARDEETIIGALSVFLIPFML